MICDSVECFQFYEPALKLNSREREGKFAKCSITNNWVTSGEAHPYFKLKQSCNSV